MTEKEEIIQLKKALAVASAALNIAADWNVNEVQVHPPKEWDLDAYNENPEDGWCSYEEEKMGLDIYAYGRTLCISNGV